MNETINKKKIAELMSETSEGEYYIYECRDMLDLFCKVIHTEILKGNKVELAGLGCFVPKYSKAKRLFDMNNGGYINTEPSVTLKFRTSAVFNAKLKKTFKQNVIE
jgi:nucleoid DNA-binding protein